MAKSVETEHTVAELSDWLMVESSDSVSLVKRLIRRPEGCESKKDMGREETLFSSLLCMALEAAKEPLAMVKALPPSRQMDTAAKREYMIK
jgi:hypothetical protein